MKAPDFNIIDVFALVIIVVSVIVGYRRRLSGEIANMISIVAAFCMGLFFYQPLADWFLANTRLDGRNSQGIAYVFVVIAAIVVMIVLRLLLGKIMRIVIEEEFDRMGGLFAGLVRAVLFILIIFMAMNLVNHDYLNRKFGEESVVGRVVVKFIPSVDSAYEKLSTKE